MQCSWWPGAGGECLCEQQVRGRRRSTADVEGLVWEGLGEEDVKAHGLELPCQEEFGDEERRKIPPTFGLVAAVPGLCWGSSREGMEPGMEAKASPRCWHFQDYP